MKKVFLLLVAAVFSLLSANAQKENDLVISAGDSKQLILGGNMNVVLVITNPQANNVELSKEFLQKLDVKFSDGTLELAAKKDLANETLYVLVNDLKSVTVGANTNVRSDGIIQNSLDLFIDKGATAILQTKGRVEAHSLGEFDVKVKRTPIYASIAAGIN